MNYDELLDISHVPTLENRRLFLCLCTFFMYFFTILFMVLYSSHLIYSLIYVTLVPTTL